MYQTGHLLDEVKTGVILQQVNAQGKMASGFAKAIRDKWPSVWEHYSRLVTPGDDAHTFQHLGKVILVEVEDGLYIANLVGQQFYGRDVNERYTSYDALDDALHRLRTWIDNSTISTEEIHHPLIGCGLGNGQWSVVEALIRHNLGDRTTLWTQPT
jgi:hypothetical protein